MTSPIRRPDMFDLDPTRIEEAQRRFCAQGWLSAGQELRSLAIAGAGNMNLTLRAQARDRTFIVKQGRPWVEKYPSIAAPADRTLTEAAFYRAVGRDPELARLMPAYLGVDTEARILALEDMGAVGDLTSLYAGGDLLPVELVELARFLSRLHALPIEEAERSTFRNEPMRRLNHEHIFVIPFVGDNGIDLDAITPGLKQRARDLADDRELLEHVAQLGGTYLGSGPCLLHGDYYPGSWLRTAHGIRVIDPEFCFLGPPELDLGVALGHLVLAGRPVQELRSLFEHYHGPRAPRRDLALRFAGVEIMRRLLGVAQLPLSADLSRRAALIARARTLIVRGAE